MWAGRECGGGGRAGGVSYMCCVCGGMVVLGHTCRWLAVWVGEGTLMWGGKYGNHSMGMSRGRINSQVEYM